jgi:Protein of unknown function (DUF2637)
MTADRADLAVRWTAALALVAVAAVAAYVSYWHAVEVVTGHAEPGIIGHLYPVLIDGIIIAASMVLLDAARHTEPPSPLAWWMLGSGVAVTLAANVAYGWRHGWPAALWAAWPAAAFVGCYETMMLLVRASASRVAAVPGAAALSAVASDAETAAMASMRATAAAGNPWSQNQLVTRFGLTRPQATRVRQAALAETNGHVTGEEVSGDG